MGKYLLGKDTVNGAEGSIFITKDGKNIEIAGMKNIKTNAELQNNDMKVIGTRVIQDKISGVKQTGTGNIYYGSKLFRDMVLSYIRTGKVETFDIQITNNDPATSVGRQVDCYYGCHLTGTIPLAILDSEQAMMAYDFAFVYTSIAEIESFTDPESYGSN